MRRLAVLAFMACGCVDDGSEGGPPPCEWAPHACIGECRVTTATLSDGTVIGRMTLDTAGAPPGEDYYTESISRYQDGILASAVSSDARIACYPNGSTAFIGDGEGPIECWTPSGARSECPPPEWAQAFRAAMADLDADEITVSESVIP